MGATDTEESLLAAEKQEPRLPFKHEATRRQRISEARAALGDIDNADPDSPFSCAFSYKGRLVENAPLLHVAIWLEVHERAEFGGKVKKLITKINNSTKNTKRTERADRTKSPAWMDAMTTYKAKDKYVTVNAIILAAGLGSVEVLDTLTDGLLDNTITELVSTWAKIGGDNHYTPLHEACYLGRTNTIEWLLEHGAQVNIPNFDNMTPLHLFVASGDYDDLEKVGFTVLKLLERKASLDKAKIEGQFKKRWAETQEPELLLTPLEVAAQCDVNFPEKFMGHLASSLRSGACLSELTTIGRKSPKEAVELAKSILVRAQQRPHMRDILAMDAQQADAQEKLVRLMNSSPIAASTYLESLMWEPVVQHPFHHPIRQRTSLQSRIRGIPIPMRCEYLPDACLKDKAKASVPEWFYHAAQHWYPKWHDKLVPKAHDANDACDVKVKALSMPDILNVGFMQAVASVNPVTFCAVFDSKPVQGIVTGMWDTLVVRIYSMEMLIALIDALVLLDWGLALDWDEALPYIWDLERNASWRKAPFHWSWLAGTCACECLALLSWFLGWFCHWPRPSFDTKMDTLRFAWSSSFLDDFLIEVVMMTFLLIFLVLELLPGETEAMSLEAQACLALNVFIRCMKMVGSLTVIQDVGAQIIAVLHSMFSGAMRPMLFIAAAVFGVFDLAFLVLSREESPSSFTMFLYRGLLFGDGDGLDRFGFTDNTNSTYYDKDHPQLFTLFGTLASILFSIVILNLIIAVYSDEYRSQSRRAPKVFFHERAKMCASRMLKYQTLGVFFPLRLLKRVCCIAIPLLAVTESVIWFEYSFPLMTFGLLVGAIQFALLTAAGHSISLPDESIPEEVLSTQSRSTEHVLAHLSERVLGLGVHPSVPAPSLCSGALSVKHAALRTSHCVEVRIECGQSSQSIAREDAFKKATLSFIAESKRYIIKPVGELPEPRDEDGSNEVTLVFEPVMNIWGPLEVHIDGRVLPVRLPRFLWLCCRENDEQADELDELQQAIRVARGASRAVAALAKAVAADLDASDAFRRAVDDAAAEAQAADCVVQRRSSVFDFDQYIEY